MKFLNYRETKKLLEEVLRKVFPGLKFSIKKAGSGRSVYLTWVDGPSVKEMQMVAAPFSESVFDGMTDYRGSKTAFSPDGEEFSPGIDFIFYMRVFSDNGLKKVIEKAKELGYPEDALTFERETCCRKEVFLVSTSDPLNYPLWNLLQDIEFQKPEASSGYKVWRSF